MAMPTDGYKYFDRFVHLGLAAFGVAAYLIALGEGAEHHYQRSQSFGYLLHAYLGFTVGFFIVLRLLRGMAGPAGMKFRQWLPLHGEQWRLIAEDLRGLTNLRVPDRQSHEGIAGVVQVFGLAIFAWMALTGTGLFVIDQLDAGKALWRSMKEAHELGETLIPVFLGLHVGAVILHSVIGRPVWPRMFSLGSHRNGARVT